MKPAFSVIVPTYNKGSCLAEAVLSALDCVYPTEVIIVDDGSTNDTANRVDRIRGQIQDSDIENKDIRYIRHSENKGVSAARNTGICAAKGEYIAFLDSDDCWGPGKLVAQFGAVLAAPHFESDVFCLTYFRNKHPEGIRTINDIFLEDYVNDNGAEQCVFKKYFGDELKKGVVSWDLWFGSGSTLFAHRSAIEKTGLFDENLSIGEDTEYLLRHILRRGELSVLPEFFMEYNFPAPDKVYPRQKDHFHYMINKHLYAVKDRFGPVVANRFVTNLLSCHVTRSYPKSDWEQAAREVLASEKNLGRPQQEAAMQLFLEKATLA